MTDRPTSYNEYAGAKWLVARLSADLAHHPLIDFCQEPVKIFARYSLKEYNLCAGGCQAVTTGGVPHDYETLVRYGLFLIISLTNLDLVSPDRAAPRATSTRQALPPALILETEFDPSEWTVTAEAVGGLTYTVTQQLTGGYAGPEFRFLAHRLPPVTNGGLHSIEVTHISVQPCAATAHRRRA